MTCGTTSAESSPTGAKRVVVKMGATEGVFQDEPALVLSWGDLQAIVLPDVGGNLVSFRDRRRNFRFLHEPESGEMEAFRAAPYLYGMPVLFPPNRYDGGSIQFAGTHYQLPINESWRGNHLHGFLYDIPWQVEDFGTTRLESYVVLSQTVDECHPRYPLWPHNFLIKIRYSLSEFGLSQQVLVANTGETAMPCLLGFHTAVNAPFAENAEPDDYRCRLSVGERWELDDRGLPTGRKLPFTERERSLREGGMGLFDEPMDHHYTAKPMEGRNRMELLDTRNQVTLVYDVDQAFRHWMLWNNSATPGFFCPEPQVNAVNAPNVHLPAETVGLFAIQPGELWEATSRMYVRSGTAIDTDSD